MGLVDAFVGRNAEVQSILDVLSSDETGGVLLSAPSGTGKSRLAREVVDELTAAGVLTVSVRGSVAARRVPLGALSTAPELQLSVGSSTLAPIELADQYVTALSERTAGETLVVLADDAHLLDDMSMLVIERLAQTEHISVLLTARTGEGGFDTLTEMCTRGPLTSIVLGPLGREESRTLVKHALSGEVDAALMRQLFERSEGNPLFLLELLRGSLESDRLTQLDGIWTLQGGELSPTQRVRDVVESRLRGLRADEIGLVETLAFIDRMDRDAIDHFSSVETLLSLETRGLVTTTLDQRKLSATLAHPIYGELVQASMSGLKTQLTTQALANYLEQKSGLDDGACMQLAALRLLAGGGKAEVMRRAAEIAMTRHDLELALECADASVEIDSSIDSRLLRARVLSCRGDFEAADAELAGCIESATTDDQLLQAAILRLDLLTFYRGNVKDALALAGDIEDRVRDPHLRETLRVRRAGALLHTDGPLAVAEAVTPLLEAETSEVESWACMLASWAYLRLGKFSQAVATTRRGEAAQHAHTYPTDWYSEVHSVIRCYANAGTGDLVNAHRDAVSGLEQALEQQADEAIGGYSLFLSTLSRDCGHTDEALRNADLALTTYRRLGRTVYVADAIVYRALALAISGDGAAALTALDDLRETQIADYWYFSPELLQAKAWAHAVSGLQQRARELFIESATVGARSGDLIGALTAWHGCARIGFPRPALKPMERIVRQTDSRLAAVRLNHVIGLANQDSAALQQASERFEELGADLLAGEAATAAAGALQRHGSPRAAEHWRRRATSIFRRQSGQVSATLQPRVVNDLTPAEAETAELAAQGRPNAEIANLLGLSVRTVENRLQRAYIKLGVSSRQALADLLH